MHIKSLQIHVPAGCLNKCEFCVSAQHNNRYKTVSSKERYGDCIKFAKDNGCNSMVISSSGEPMMNEKYILNVLKMNRNSKDPFQWIELQTSGMFLNDNILKKFYKLGLKTVSLSLSSIWHSGENFLYNGAPPKICYVEIIDTCNMIIRQGLNLRLSLNMTDKQLSDERTPADLFEHARILLANSITFRKLYADPQTPQGKWIKRYGLKKVYFQMLNHYITGKGEAGELLPSGDRRYFVDGISTVIYDDCMAKQNNDDFRYLILRPNCRLYTRWDDDGSILF